MLGHLTDIDAIHQDLAFGDIVKTRNKIDQGGLAAAGAADKGGGLSGRGGKREFLSEHSPPRRDSGKRHSETPPRPLTLLANFCGLSGSLMLDSVSRPRDTLGGNAARGSMINIIETIRKAMIIWMAYCIKAIILPTCIDALHPPDGRPPR